jgi:hypothetical protein
LGNWILTKSLVNGQDEERDIRELAGDYAISNRKIDDLNTGLKRFLKEDLQINVRHSDFNKIMGAVRDIERNIKKWG